MKLAACSFAALALVSLAAVGCSSSDDAAENTGPVAATPLQGSIEGQDFVAKSALARKGFEDGEKSIEIYDTDVKCADFSPKAPRHILVSVPWKAGTARDFKFALGEDGQTATFVIERESKTDNVISTQGRIEIVEAPSEAGATGKIRIRAVAQESSIEGEIAVEVCE